jgi:hypothetical protein
MEPKETGYIKIWRSIFSDELYDDPRIKHNIISAWYDLLLLANWSDSDYGDRVIRRGQVARSKKFLAMRWRVNEKTVSKWLQRYKMQGKIVIDSTRGGTLITILNYAKYQGSEGVDDSEGGAQSGAESGTPYGAQGGAQSGIIRRINKNNIKRNKEEERIIPRFARDPVEDY